MYADQGFFCFCATGLLEEDKVAWTLPLLFLVKRAFRNFSVISNFILKTSERFFQVTRMYIKTVILKKSLSNGSDNVCRLVSRLLYTYDQYCCLDYEYETSVSLDLTKIEIHEIIQQEVYLFKFQWKDNPCQRNEFLTTLLRTMILQNF